MKKILKKASALLIVGLVACTGRTITREQAIAVLQDIKAKQAEEGFVYATDFSVTQVTHMTASNGYYADYSTHLMYNAAEQKVKYEAQTVEEAGSNSGTESQVQWFYIDSGTMYQVTDSDTSSGHNKVYNRITEGVDEAWAELVTSVQTMFNQSLAQTCNPDFYIGALQGSITQDTTTTEVTIKSELYTSSGDGNIVGSFVGSGSEGTTEYNSLNANFTFDNNRIVHSYVVITVDSAGSTAEISGMAITCDYLYNNIVITLPNLADFTDTTTPANPQ